MIRTWKHKGLKKLFEKGITKGIDPKHASKLRAVLEQLDSATRPEQMNFPGSRFHELQGVRKGTYSIRVSGNWRVTFRLEDEDAYEVNYEDYH